MIRSKRIYPPLPSLPFVCVYIYICTCVCVYVYVCFVVEEKEKGGERMHRRLDDGLVVGSRKKSYLQKLYTAISGEAEKKNNNFARREIVSFIIIFFLFSFFLFFSFLFLSFSFFFFFNRGIEGSCFPDRWRAENNSCSRGITNAAAIRRDGKIVRKKRNEEMQD